jgi:hypothetical protein
MMAKIHTLRTTAATDRESVVRTLEKMLRHAHEGHVQAVAVAWVGPTGRVNAAWSHSNAASMLGAVSLLQYRLLNTLEIDGQR